jgi:outer membrane protein OmpA-like peptidoglycan-associated protein
VANILKQYPDIRISITGHTCNSDKETENIQTGIARATAVALYLRSKGIDRSRIDISSDSESHEYLSYDPAANYRNRKAVITVE